MKKLIFSILLSVVTLSAVAESRTDKLLRELHNPKSDYVFVISHRGDWRNFPENSLEGFEAAIKMGVDMVEVDVHRTADGVLVACHDKTLNRTTSLKGKIAEMTFDEMRNAKLRNGIRRVTNSKLPTLAEVFDLCNGRVLINIDKGINYYDEIMAMLIERNMVEQVLIKASRTPDEMKELFAGHKQNMLYMPIINYNEKHWGKHEQLFADYIASDLPFVAYEMCWNGTIAGEKRVFKQVLNDGKRLWINALWPSLCGGDKNPHDDDAAVGNEEKIYGKLLSYGTTMIQSDRPQMLINYLDKVGRHTLK